MELENNNFNNNFLEVAPKEATRPLGPNTTPILWESTEKAYESEGAAEGPSVVLCVYGKRDDRRRGHGVCGVARGRGGGVRGRDAAQAGGLCGGVRAKGIGTEGGRYGDGGRGGNGRHGGDEDAAEVTSAIPAATRKTDRMTRSVTNVTGVKFFPR